MNENTPFIHLLKSPNSGYVFDVNKNEIVDVEDDIYQYLDKTLKGVDMSNADESVKQKIEQLQELGYLSSKIVKEIKHPYVDCLDTFLDRKVEKITLQLTQNCNFRCSYCAYSHNNGTQRTHSSKKMSLELAKKAVDFLLNHSQDSQEANVGFYGGEPLLEFDLIKDVIEYSEQVFTGKRLTFTITTNGTLLTDEIVEYFIAHNVDMMISLDGPKEINDKSRVFAANGKGTFDTVFSKIQHISEEYPQLIGKISISMVMNPQNDFDDINSIFTENDLFNKIHVRSTIIDDIASEEKNVYSEEFVSKNEYHQFLAFLSSMNRIEKDKVSPIAYQNIQSIQDTMDKMFSSNGLPDVAAPGGPCVPGEMRLFISVDGDFFPCERVSETSSAMKIGSIETGFDMKKAKALLNIGSLTSEECKNCWAFNRCTLCAKYADDGETLSASRKLTNCDTTRRRVSNDLTNMILLQEAKILYK